METVKLPHYSEDTLTLPAMASWPETQHVYGPGDMDALMAAELAGRPLLVRGDPGVGKSQLAHAAAVSTQRLFLPFVVDSRTEATDLMWRYDAVARLANAHLAGVPDSGIGPDDLQPERYLQPGPLWWAFDWAGAVQHLKDTGQQLNLPAQPPYPWGPEKGVVLLIDEIDKAEAELPNGLLEALGNGRFTVPLMGTVVERKAGMPAPLVVITTNDESELPAAFLRRCWVRRMQLPDATALPAYLVQRGMLHFPDLAARHAEVLARAADMLNSDREEARREGLYACGMAEYLDLLRALDQFWKAGHDPAHYLGRLSEFVFKKQTDSDLR